MESLKSLVSTKSTRLDRKTDTKTDTKPAWESGPPTRRLVSTLVSILRPENEFSPLYHRVDSSGFLLEGFELGTGCGSQRSFQILIGAAALDESTQPKFFPEL